MIIRRKPVGSGVSPKRAVAQLHSPSIHEGSSAVAGGHHDQVQTPSYASHYDFERSRNNDHNEHKKSARRSSIAWEPDAEAFHPDDLLSCSPGAYRSRGSPERSENRKQRPKPPVRFASKTDSSSSVPTSEASANRDEVRTAGASARKRNLQSPAGTLTAMRRISLEIP